MGVAIFWLLGVSVDGAGGGADVADFVDDGVVAHVEAEESVRDLKLWAFLILACC